jgi:hypothetical protein
MKRKELYEYVRESIVNELTVTPVTSANVGDVKKKISSSSGLTNTQKTALTKSATPGSTINLPESELEEARKANNLKVGSQEKFEAAKDLYEGGWIANLLNFISEAGEEGISQKDLAEKLGKKDSANINPAIQELKMVKAIATTRIKGDTAPEVTEPEEDDVIAVAGGEEEEEEDTFYKVDKEFDSPEAEEEPKMADIKAAEKTNSKDYAKILSPEEEEKYTKIRKGIEAKVVKLSKLSKDKRTSSDDMKVLKQLIAREDVKKLFKDKGVNLKSIVADIIT